MIRVTIDLVTHATGSEGKQLYALEIVNDGTGTPVVGNYDVVVLDEDNNIVDTCKLWNWPRQMNAWEMLMRIVKIFARREAHA